MREIFRNKSQERKWQKIQKVSFIEQKIFLRFLKADIHKAFKVVAIHLDKVCTNYLIQFDLSRLNFWESEFRTGDN